MTGGANAPRKLIELINFLKSVATFLCFFWVFFYPEGQSAFNVKHLFLKMLNGVGELFSSAESSMVKLEIKGRKWVSENMALICMCSGCNTYGISGLHWRAVCLPVRRGVEEFAASTHLGSVITSITYR